MLYIFTYSEDDEYQDATGALYDTVTRSWMGQKDRLISMKYTIDTLREINARFLWFAYTYKL